MCSCVQLHQDPFMGYVLVTFMHTALHWQNAMQSHQDCLFAVFVNAHVCIINTEQNKLEGTERGSKSYMHKHYVQNSEINGTIPGSLVPLQKYEQVTQKPQIQGEFGRREFRKLP